MRSARSPERQPGAGAPSSTLSVHDGEDERTSWVCRFPLGEPGGWGVHHHRQHQLAWVSEGAGRARVGGADWAVRPDRAVWIPSEHPHDLFGDERARLHVLYVWPAACLRAWAAPTSLEMTPLARELVLSLADAAPLGVGPGDDGLEVPVADATVTVLLAHLRPVPGEDGEPLRLPLPTDPRAAELAAALLEDPSSDATLPEWARRLATSERTLRRAFADDTGLTFGEWRTRVRLREALDLLDRGLSVEQVAWRVGYSSTSGFTAAFRRVLGRTPGAVRTGSSSVGSGAR